MGGKCGKVRLSRGDGGKVRVECCRAGLRLLRFLCGEDGGHFGLEGEPVVVVIIGAHHHHGGGHCSCCCLFVGSCCWLVDGGRLPVLALPSVQ